MRGSFQRSALIGLLLAPLKASSICSSWSNRYQTNLKGVCVCNATQCDTVSNEFQSLIPGQIGVYTTSKAGTRFEYKILSFDATTVHTPTYILNVSTQYQTMIGFGGAFTDAAALNIYKLSSTLQQMVIDQYYSDEGLEYSLGRVPIGSTDFSTKIYSYNDVLDDLAQEHFSIDEDRESNKIDLIQRALRTSTRKMKLFASSWAPPAWMTRENSTINCAVKGDPGTAYWQSLALYYSKFFDKYKMEGIAFWAMTVQNEPIRSIFQLSAWQSLRMSDTVQRDFVKLDLGPMMSAHHPKLKIIAGDDQKAGILSTLAPFEDADSRHYISGLGVHWYHNLDFLLSGDFDKLLVFHKKYPKVFMLATEACEGFLPSWLGTGSGPTLQDDKKSWLRAENYGRDIIEDMNNFVGGWTDWNLVLDTKGGPNWAENFVDAPILVDEDTGDEFYKQPMFYIMGHFSKFVPPGSRRIEFLTTKTLRHVHRTAVVTPENYVVMQFLNRANANVTVSVRLTDAKTFTLKLFGHSMQTVILPPSDDTKVQMLAPNLSEVIETHHTVMLE